jgi:hypothetical protein
VETKETPLSKVVVPMPQVTHVIWAQEPGVLLKHESRMPQVGRWAIILLLSITPIRASGLGDSTECLSWLACSASLARSPLSTSERLLFRCQSGSGAASVENWSSMEMCERVIPFEGLDLCAGIGAG